MIKCEHGARYEQARTFFRRIDMTRKLSFQTARTEHRDPLQNKSGVMQACTTALKDKMAYKDEMKELEDFPEHHYQASFPFDAFVTRSDVIAMNADETKKTTANMVTESATSIVKDFTANLFNFYTLPQKKGLKHRSSNQSRKPLLMWFSRTVMIRPWDAMLTTWLSQTNLWTHSPTTYSTE